MKPGVGTSAAANRKGFRLDIQGIRGFALVLVLLTHAEIPHLGGGFVGLDIFFVLSGFLITRLILAELDSTGGISLLRFYARRAKRLLPLAFTVLAFVAIVSMILFSSVRNDAVSGDIVASGLYFVNWRFIAQTIHYFAFDLATSPVQHYWSLSVEEQFYLLWPALMLVSTWWARRHGGRVRAALWAAFLATAIAAFVYGLQITASDPDAAYFSTPARGWELAAGGLLALALPEGIRLGRRLAAALASAGLMTIVVTTLLFTSATPYPGWRALLPVLATAAVIVAGSSQTICAPIRALSWEPLQHLGRVSYAWYLWHWPLIMFAMEIWGTLSPEARLAVTAVSWVPAVITHHLIEEPLRRSRGLMRPPARALGVGLGCTGCAALLGLFLSVLQPTVPTAPVSATSGAKKALEGAPLQRSADELRPTPRRAADDRGRMHDDGCVVDRRTEQSPPCIYGDRSSDTTVVLFGDSHAGQYFPALLPLARKHHWRLVGLARMGCPIADMNYLDGCDRWRANTMGRITRRLHPSLIVVSSSTAERIQPMNEGERVGARRGRPILLSAYMRTLRRLRATGAKVVVIRDQARAPFNPPDCVAKHRHHLRRCAFDAKRSKNDFDARGARRVDGVTLIDPLPVLCPRHVCPSVMGNALVYRNSYHLSATFARTLAPWLDRELPRPAPASRSTERPR